MVFSSFNRSMACLGRSIRWSVMSGLILRRPIFMRCQGTIQTPLSRSISDHSASINSDVLTKVSIMRLTAMRVGMKSRSRFPSSAFKKAGNSSGLMAAKCCLLTLFRTSIRSGIGLCLITPL